MDRVRDTPCVSGRPDAGHVEARACLPTSSNARRPGAVTPRTAPANPSPPPRSRGAPAPPVYPSSTMPQPSPSSPQPALVLASGSPRRRDLLDALGLAFTVRPADLDETPHSGETPRAYVERLAQEKATARAEPGELVLAADTSVILDGEILGKPEDEADGRRLLGLLAGREHVVLSGVALHLPDPEGSGAGGTTRTHVEESRVRIAALTPEEIAWYVATGETMDKAGGYAIQGLGAMYVESVHGDYTNVVGLPLPATYRLFRALGLELRDFRTEETRR